MFSFKQWDLNWPRSPFSDSFKHNGQYGKVTSSESVILNAVGSDLGIWRRNGRINRLSDLLRVAQPVSGGGANTCNQNPESIPKSLSPLLIAI